MFLKRIEMQGFKSFADKVVIQFEDSVTGIVGPNGCGKSNITDAIRWVLGEQSVKSLRGDKMTDVIFAGSADRKMVNMAEVTLVFDNTKRYLNSEQDEIEITRRIFRNGQDAEYLINRNPSRLKDIVELILDSGLGKDSLSMISQGNIVSFAEAKTIERRAIFEEAAGVSKYKKRKIESLNKLARTKDNLDRAFDILNELEKQVSPLKRQAKKAELYREKKARLEQIEIAVLVEEIKQLNLQKEEIKKSLFDIETNTMMHQTQIQVFENTTIEAKQEVHQLDREINKLQDDLMKTVNEIQILETRKIELDEKRKYLIEVGNSEEKALQLQSLLDEAKFEYDDRYQRLNKIHAEIQLLSKQLSDTALELINTSQAKEEADSVLRRNENRKEVLENLIKEPFNNQAGVKAIMDNKQHLFGVIGVVGQAIKPKNGYEEAIATALGFAMYNIVTKDEESARHAIAFLKKNQSGRATFLPLSVLKQRNIGHDHSIICQNTKGYLGLASEFVDCGEEFALIKLSLLNNVLVTDSLEHGNRLARLLNYQYKIVTLDGDFIAKGGAMTGGKIKNATSLLTVQKEYDNIIKDLQSYQARKELAYKAYFDIVKQKEEIDRNIQEKRIQSAQLEPVVDAKRAKYEKLKSDLELLGGHKQQEVDFSNTVVQSLNQAYSLRDQISTSIKLKRDNRLKVSADIERKEQQIRQLRKELQQTVEQEKIMISSQAKIETKLENNLNRLTSEYQLTYEFALEKYQDDTLANAKEEVLTLRNEIDALGNINMNAPEEYSEVNTRYEFMKKNYDDLCNSRDKILKAIDEMDSIMIKQFKEMFDKINQELNHTFTALFSGGKAKLILEDPNDILNTGIDIDVQPPGKSVQNIRLFSGGEKTLIAICVLFTILKVRPVPLVIFDEVEAALDQGNVERFAKYIKNFSEDTQFIIVTHRPGTMAQADVLYGVTMQKQGVSQMLKVKLLDAVSMADERQGE